MIEYKRGTYFSFLTYARNKITKLPESLVGATVESQLRKFVAGRPVPGDAGLIAQLDCVIVNAAQGIARISYDQTLAAAWELQTACLDIVYVMPGGERVPTEKYQTINIVDPATEAIVP